MIIEFKIYEIAKKNFFDFKLELVVRNRIENNSLKFLVFRVLEIENARTRYTNFIINFAIDSEIRILLSGREDRKFW